MASDQELLIRINGNAKDFIDEIDKINKKTKDLQAGLGKIAKGATVAFVALAGAVGLTVVRFAQFEKEFTNVQTLLDKTSFSTKTLTQGVEGLKKGILALGAESGQSFATLNKGLFDIISSTGDAENAMGVLESATRLAIAGGTDVSIAVDGITTSIKAFGLETSDAQQIAEKFFQAQKGGKTTVAELASAMGLVASSANAFGVSLDEVLAATSAATLAGIKTKTAFTGLKAVFAGIAKPTKEAQVEAKRLGVEFSSTALRSQGLEGFLGKLTSANGFTQKSIEKLFGSTEAQGILFALTGAQAGDFTNQLKLLADEQAAAATFAEAFAVKQATTSIALDRLRVSLDAIAVTFGAAFAPTINAAADALSAIAKNISEMDESTVNAIAVIVAVTGAFVGLVAILAGAALGYLSLKAVIISANTTLGIATGIQKAYNFILIAGRKAANIFAIGMRFVTLSVRGLAAATGIGLVIVAISIMISNWETTVAIFKGTIAFLKVIFTALGDAIKKKFEETFGSAIKKVTEFKNIVFKAFTDVGSKVKEIFDKITNAVTNSVNKIKTLLNQIPGVALKIGTDVGNAIEKGVDAATEKIPDKIKAVGSAAADAFNKAFGDSISEQKRQADIDAGISPEDDSATREKAVAAARQEEADKQAAIADEKAKGLEDANALEEEEKALKLERIAEEDEADIQRILDKAMTKEEIAKEFALKELDRNVKDKNQFLRDEMKFGESIARFKQIMRNKEVQGALSTNNQLIQLTNSKNSTLKGIGKAASIVQIGVKTAEGAISAYTSLAGIPVVGPALGAAAAAALIAFGAEQIGNVLSAAQGGIVPGGTGGARDRIPALLEPGELVVPRQITSDFIQSIGRPEAANVGEAGGGANVEVMVGFKDEAFEIIEQKLLERRAIGSGGL